MALSSERVSISYETVVISYETANFSYEMTSVSYEFIHLSCEKAFDPYENFRVSYELSDGSHDIKRSFLSFSLFHFLWRTVMRFVSRVSGISMLHMLSDGDIHIKMR